MQLQLFRVLIQFLIPGLGLVSNMSRIEIKLRPKWIQEDNYLEGPLK